MKREGTMIVDTSWDEPPMRIRFERHNEWGTYVPERTCEGCSHLPQKDKRPFVCDTCSRAWFDHYDKEVK